MEHLYGPSAIGAQDIACITCDRTDVLYGIAGTNSSYSGLIVSYDLRENLLSEGQQALGRSVLAIPASQPSQIIRTSPPVSFDVHSITAAASGRYLAVSGYDREDNDGLVISVVDVHGGKVLPPQQTGDDVIAGDAGQDQQQQPKQRLCMAYNVDYQLFASRPGLKLLQVSWHPYSDAHLVVLTNDSRIRIYSLSDLSAAQLTLNVKLNSQSRKDGRYGVLQHARSAVDQACSFAFGPATGWGPFTLYVAGTSGHMYGLCPVTPPGMRVPSSVLQQCALDAAAASEEGVQGQDQGNLAGVVQAWLEAAFGVQDWEELQQAQGRLEVVPHVLPEQSVACQGPLNLGQESAAPSAHVCTSIAAVHHLTPAPAAPPPQELAQGVLSPSNQGRLCVTSALLTGTAQGPVWAHALSAQLLPAWAPVSPQCVLGVGGDATAVRCECEVVSPPSFIKAILVDKVELPLVGAAPTSQGLHSRAPSPSPTGRLSPALTPLRSPSPSPVPGRLGLLGSEDEDEVDGLEEEEGGGVGSKGTCQQGQGLVLLVEDTNIAAAGGAGGSGSSGTSGTTSRLDQQQGSVAGYPTVWATHASGCWALGLAWLPFMSAASSGSGGARSSGSAVAATASGASLPPVVTHELWAPGEGSGSGSGSCATSSTLLQDVFFGTQLLLLVQGEGTAAGEEGAVTSGGTLLCCRPRPVAPSPASGGLTRGASAGVDSTSAAAGTDGTLAISTATGGVSAGAEASVEASIQALYGDLLCSPPYSDAIPRGKGSLLVSTPEGAAALTAAIRSLRQGAVEGAHAAHQALRLRAAQLAVEASSHAAAVEELQGVKSDLEARQATLTDRLLKAVQLHTNLSERTALLAQLHWSLPRPLSDAERQLSSDLDVLVARRETLAATWEATRRRAELMVEQRSASLAAAGAHMSRLQSTPGPAQTWSSRAGGVSTTPQRPALGTPVGGLMSRTTTPGTGKGRGFTWSGMGGTPSRVLVATPAAGTPRQQQQQQQQQQLAPAGGPGLPPAQLSKVHTTLLDLLQQTTSCASQVQALEKDVQAWAGVQEQQKVEQELHARK